MGPEFCAHPKSLQHLHYYHPYYEKHDCPTYQTTNSKMHFIATVFLYLVLLFSSTFAEVPVPEGYRIVSVTDLGDEKTNESKDNPHAPLLNATLSCYKENHATLLWRNYDLWGTGWYGVSEKSIKFACANANACMTRWKFETWNTTLCHDNADGSEECVENLPVWHATVSLPEEP